MAVILECQIAKRQNDFKQETFWHKAGSVSTKGSWDIVIFMFMLFLIAAIWQPFWIVHLHKHEIVQFRVWAKLDLLTQSHCRLLCSPKGEHIVAALSVRPSTWTSVCPSIHPSICPSHFCLEHIPNSIEGNLMKLDTLIEGHEEELQNARTVTMSPVFTDLLPLFNFCNKMLVRSISLKV